MKGKISFKKGSKAAQKRSEIAEAIMRKNPKMKKSKKFAIATAAAKKAIGRKNING
jgi:hypothetical protein